MNLRDCFHSVLLHSRVLGAFILVGSLLSNSSAFVRTLSQINRIPQRSSQSDTLVTPTTQTRLYDSKNTELANSTESTRLSSLTRDYYSNRTIFVNESYGASPNNAPIVIPPISSLGDIMSSGLDTTLATNNDKQSSTTLAQCYGIHHPLDRMALTANGNLQRLLASFYDSPVKVVVKSCNMRKKDGADNSSPSIWDRVVHLCLWETTTVCVATSVIYVHDPVCRSLVASGCVGIGQLFRFLNVLPEFVLVNAGPQTDGGGFWREYELSCPEVTCHIREEFVADMWNAQPPTADR